MPSRSMLRSQERTQHIKLIRLRWTHERIAWWVVEGARNPYIHSGIANSHLHHPHSVSFRTKQGLDLVILSLRPRDPTRPLFPARLYIEIMQERRNCWAIHLISVWE